MPKDKQSHERVEYKLFDLDKEILDAFVPLYNFGIKSVEPLNPFHLKHSSDEEPFDYDTESEDDVSFSSNTDSEFGATPPQNEVEALEKEMREAEKKDIVLPKIYDYTLLEEHVWREDYKEGQIYHDRARDKWFEDEGCIATALGASICAYSLWTFPNLCVEYGGIYFCIIYLILTILVSVPIIYLELIVGQFRQKGTLHCWIFFPLFKGVGFVMIINAFFDIVVNTTILSYFGYYMFECLRFQAHWGSCSREWTTLDCVDFDAHVTKSNLRLVNISRSPAFEYFRARVLRIWKSDFADKILTTHPFGDGAIFGDSYVKYVGTFDKASNGKAKYDINNIGVPALDLAIICGLFFLSAYTALKYRVRFLGTSNFFVLFVGYIFLCFAFVHAWVQPYGKHGSDEFENPEEWKMRLFNTQAWAAALKHCVLSCGFGTGVYFTIGSNQRFDNRRIKVIAFAAGFGSWITHSVLGLMMFMYWYGAHSYQNTGDFTDSYFGNDLIFEIYPMTRAIDPEKHFVEHYSFCFYCSLVLLSCGRSYSGIYMIETAFKDSYKRIFDALRFYYDGSEGNQIHRWERFRCLFNDYSSVARLLQIIIGLAFIVVLVCLTRGGIFILLFIQSYSFEMSRCLVFFLEIFAFTMMWGTKNLDETVQAMTGIQSTIWFRVIWKLFCPLVIIFYLVHNGVIPDAVEFDGVKMPPNYHYIGIVFGLGPFMFCLLFFAFKTIISVPVKKFKDKLKLSIAPEYEWICLASGQLRSNRTHLLHYVYFPVGFSKGKGATRLPQEMYHHFKGLGKKLRSYFMNLCCIGFYSANLFFLTSATQIHRHRSPIRPMKLAQPKDEPVLEEEEDADQKFIKDLKKRDKGEDPSKSINARYLTDKEEDDKLKRKRRLLRGQRRHSQPNVAAHKGKVHDDKVNAILKSLEVGALRKSMEERQLSTGGGGGAVSPGGAVSTTGENVDIVTETLSEQRPGSNEAVVAPSFNENFNENFTEEDYKNNVLEAEVKPEEVGGSVSFTVVNFDDDAHKKERKSVESKQERKSVEPKEEAKSEEPQEEPKSEEPKEEP